MHFFTSMPMSPKMTLTASKVSRASVTLSAESKTSSTSVECARVAAACGSRLLHALACSLSAKSATNGLPLLPKTCDWNW